MIVSRYTLFANIEGKFYLYNTLTRGLVQIDEKLYSMLVQCKDKHTFVPSIKEIETLSSYRFLVDSDKTEFEYLKSELHKSRLNNEYAHITIAPTLNCCFSCYYCFEKLKSSHTISKETINSIVDFIGSKKNLKRLYLTWFGGEPLLAIDVIKNIYELITEKFKGQIISEIITSGYLLNDYIIDVISQINISNIQITLDGWKGTHNKVKYTNNDKNTYDKTVENIAKLCNIPGLKIVVRVNITGDNMTDFIKVYRQIKSINSNIYINPAPVIDASGNSIQRCIHYLDNDKYFEFLTNLFDEYRIITTTLWNDDMTTECAVRHINSYVFGPSGEIYKCWENLGDSNFCIGAFSTNSVFISGHGQNIFSEINETDPLKNRECIECAYLPLCYGGCPINRVKNLHKSININEGQCTIYKERFHKWLGYKLKILKYGPEY